MFIRSGYSAQTRSTRELEAVTEARSRTKHHHRATRVLLGGGHLTSGLGVQAHFDALALQVLYTDAVEFHDGALAARFTPIPLARSKTPGVAAAAARPLLSARNYLPLTFKQDRPSAHAHTGRAAHITERAHAGGLRRRHRVAASAIERLKRRDYRAGEQTTHS